MTKWVRDDGGDVSNADGLAYAKFIDTFAKALHAADKELSLDFFTDLPICASSVTASLSLSGSLSCTQHTTTTPPPL